MPPVHSSYPMPFLTVVYVIITQSFVLFKDSHLIYSPWNKFDALWDPLMSLIQVCCPIVSVYITKLKDDRMLTSGNVFDQNMVFSMLSFCDRLLDVTVHISDCSMFFGFVSLFSFQACYVTCCGQTQTKMFRAGERTIGEFPSPLGPMSSANFSTVMTWTSSAEHIRWHLLFANMCYFLIKNSIQNITIEN